VTLMKSLDEIKNMENRFEQARLKNDTEASKALVVELRNLISQTSTLMYDHLAEEEREITPIVKENFYRATNESNS